MIALTLTAQPARDLEPLFRYCGGKRRLMPLIGTALAPALQGAKRYVEPFLGGASVYLWLHARGLVPTARSPLVSDLSPHLVGIYRGLVAHTDEVCAWLVSVAESARCYKAEGKHKEYWYRLRAALNERWCRGCAPLDGPWTGVALYLAVQAFRGIWPVLRSGDVGWTYGDASRVPTSAELRAVASALRAAELRRNDVRAVLAECGEGDVVYLDPPYVGSTGTYGRQPVPDSFHLELAQHALAAVDRGARVFLSTPNDPEFVAQFADWSVIQTKRISYSISPLTTKQRKHEVLLCSTR